MTGLWIISKKLSKLPDWTHLWIQMLPGACLNPLARNAASGNPSTEWINPRWLPDSFAGLQWRDFLCVWSEMRMKSPVWVLMNIHPIYHGPGTLKIGVNARLTWKCNLYCLGLTKSLSRPCFIWNWGGLHGVYWSEIYNLYAWCLHPVQAAEANIKFMRSGWRKCLRDTFIWTKSSGLKGLLDLWAIQRLKSVKCYRGGWKICPIPSLFWDIITKIIPKAILWT